MVRGVAKELDMTEQVTLSLFSRMGGRFSALFPDPMSPVLFHSVSSMTWAGTSGTPPTALCWKVASQQSDDTEGRGQLRLTKFKPLASCTMSSGTEAVSEQFGQYKLKQKMKLPT